MMGCWYETPVPNAQLMLLQDYEQEARNIYYIQSKGAQEGICNVNITIVNMSQRVEQWNDGAFVSSRDWTPSDGDAAALKIAAQKLLIKWEAESVTVLTECHDLISVIGS